MTTKKILGLDLGTNSIGWALIEKDFEKNQGKILGMGSRIIPMSADILGEFDKGNSVSQTKTRTSYRSVRRLRERHLLRRQRIHRVLNILGFLPEHYSSQIDFKQRLGQFISEAEPKLAWREMPNNKFDFLFKKSFEEMLSEFKEHQPSLFTNKNKHGESIKIPYDWTIYFLRKKAITHKISKEELAWIILNFNQKRGYYQSRGEEEEDNPNKLVEFHSLKIVEVVADEKPNNKGDLWYSLHLENGWIYRRSSKIDLADWKGKVRDFIVTTDLNDDGTVKTDKEGSEKRSFRAPSDDDWTLLKKKTEQDIDNSTKTVGAYIYDMLLQKPNQKIRGKLVRTIERKFYREELKAILKKQIELQPELFSENLYNNCIRELYRLNDAHQLQLSKKDFVHLFVNDIIFYQRPLKSKKSTIGRCSLEFRTYRNADGNEIKEYLKTIPKSHPLFQEFRVWQWLYNLKIYTKSDDKDVTSEFLKNTEDLESLFEFLMSRKEVDHKDLLKFFFKDLKGKALAAEINKYRWNYVYDSLSDTSKKYPCNETGHEISRRLQKVKNLPSNFATPNIEYHLWHIIYSVSDKTQFEKALKSFSHKYNLDENSFVENFRNFKPFENDYGSYSEKAIRKLLPLMRLGKYWNWSNIEVSTQNRIDKILTGEYDEGIKERVREKAINLSNHLEFQGLQLWLAQYIVYDRHSEAALTGKWKSVKELEEFLNEFKQHSLRNPIVEQVVTETLRVVREIWVKYGASSESFFDEIHIELGREMKNTANDRKRITTQISDNENTNLRIKALLAELKNDSNVENVRPYSPMQQEALKIYEEGVLNSGVEVPDEIVKISRTANPSSSELTRYKLWLEQKYRSPYTGMMIPLSRLFSEDYQIEHIIPQSRYFDDSLTNKVICESAVNQLKSNQLGLEFIKAHHGRIVETGKGNTVKIFTEAEYRDFINQYYDKNRGKRTKLLLDEIPDQMIERQLNDTRYISKYISNLLSNIVRSDKDDDGANSKNIIPGNGKITSKLKQDWGLNDVWNDLILTRFERMNKLTNSTDFTSKNKEGHIIPTIPLELSKGFQKKRIDHRHHALDALVIACATKDHVNLLNNQSAKSDVKRYDLQRKLRNTEKWADTEGKIRDRFTEFKKPWQDFTTDARNELGKIIISFKQNVRVINKTTNKYESYRDENGNLRYDKNGRLKKDFISQVKGDSWAIRKPMHKDTVSGKINLPRIKVPKGKILTATRKNIDTSFNLKTIESITDTGIQKILKSFLAYKNNQPELAFSPEGLEELNKNIAQFNDGKSHQPILKVRLFEVGSKFPLGQTGNKKSKYVESAKGTNLFFAVYRDENEKRNYDTIPLNVVIERQKQGEYSVPETNDKGDKLVFYLSPNDLVYVPTHDEKENLNGIDFKNLSKEQIGRIYKMVSSTGNECHFIPVNVSALIKNYDAKTKIGEFGSLNKQEITLLGDQRIKEVCVKLNVDRIGNITGYAI
ncbi:MAG: type II CRISPR RNA-guided endonuclease Cas9 [Bacteroidetes bacterium]|nr:MAG: type II CRISPR RNA-guided endonuclease Cas9 [Bacteroidota bacterium]